MTTFSLILNWNPEHGGDQNIPCGTVRVTPGWHINAIDLVFAVCQPAQREIAAKTLRRLIGKQLLGESDITYVVLSQLRRIGIVSFPNAIKLLMLLGGKKAMIEREKFARVLYLFYAGDAELKTKIEDNAESKLWINILAREALKSERAAATDLQLVLAGGVPAADCRAGTTGADIRSKSHNNV
jgi:hypothetical protein